MGRRSIDISGQKFGMLTAIKPIGKDKRNNVIWECRCECGRRKDVITGNLRRGKVKSCGRHRVSSNKTHGMHGTRFYRIWSNMKQRSTNKSHRDYPEYGGRGIGLDSRWYKFENFRDDMYEEYIRHVEMYGENNTSIDRIDNSKGYGPSNCRWATRALQEFNKDLSPRNTSGHKGVSKCKLTGKWRAYIEVDGVHINLGRYGDIESAVEARKLAEEKYIITDEVGIYE